MGICKSCKDHLGNTFSSKKDMCAFYKISVKAFDGRIARGWDIEKALTTPKIDRTIMYKGKQYASLNALCKEKKIEFKTVQGRLESGYTLEESLSKDFVPKSNKTVTYQGVTYKSIREFCCKNNYKYSIVVSRLSRGYSLEESIQEKPFRTGKTIEYNGKTYRSLLQLCTENDKPAELIRSRLKVGYSITEAMDDSAIKNSGLRTYFTYDGVDYSTIKEFCVAHNIKYERFIAYKNSHNLSLEDAIKEYLIFIEKQAVEYDGVIYPNIHKLYESLGVSYNAIRYWKYKGYTFQDAITKVLKSKIIYKGKHYANYKELHDELDTTVDLRTFRARLKRGYSVEEASNPYLYQKEVVFEGKSYKGLSECCRKTGRNVATVKFRLNKGASFEDAMSLENKYEVIYKGKTYESVAELCRIKGKNIKLVQARMSMGWSLEKAIETDVINNGNEYDYKGKHYKSLVELCNDFDVSYYQVKHRLKRGYSLDEALTNDSFENKISVEYEGITYDSLRSCCKTLGKNYKCVFARMNNGYTLEEALTLPKRLYIGEYRVAECLKQLNIKFYHDCTIKTIFTELNLNIDWQDFLSELQNRLGIAGYKWSKQKIQRLRPDFVLYTDEENKICGVIEFDGEQHQNFVEFFFKTIEEFYRRSNVDFVKQSFWEYLKIPMLRIRHDQIDRIDDMVVDFIDNPQKYIYNHNTYLSENDYWSILTEQRKQIEMAFVV